MNLYSYCYFFLSRECSAELLSLFFSHYGKLTCFSLFFYYFSVTLYICTLVCFVVSFFSLLLHIASFAVLIFNMFPIKKNFIRFHFPFYNLVFLLPSMICFLACLTFFPHCSKRLPPFLPLSFPITCLVPSSRVSILRFASAIGSHDLSCMSPNSHFFIFYYFHHS